MLVQHLQKAVWSGNRKLRADRTDNESCRENFPLKSTIARNNKI
jgi:hypothetical protein